MSLLFMDGFENGLTAATGGWSAAWNSNGTTVRLTGRSNRMSGITPNTITLPSATSTNKVIMGLAIMGYGEGNYISIDFKSNSGADTNVRVLVNPSITGGAITIYRGAGSTQLATVAWTAGGASNWTYVEIEAVIDDSTGSVKVRLNGSSTDILSYEGDTRTSATSANTDKITINTTASSSYFYFDDIYVCDAAGTFNNGFLGEIRIVPLSPNGNGSNSGLTGSDGNSTDNYALVDEIAMSSTDYVGSASTGVKDTYAMADLPSGNRTVFGVKQHVMAAKSDAGAASCRMLLRHSGTDYAGDDITLTTSYVTYLRTLETNPGTSAQWLADDIDDLEAGFETR